MIYEELTQQQYDDIAARILYEDNHILIFNKRAGEIVQGDAASEWGDQRGVIEPGGEVMLEDGRWVSPRPDMERLDL